MGFITDGWIARDLVSGSIWTQAVSNALPDGETL